jgi:hypothetical protein
LDVCVGGLALHLDVVEGFGDVACHCCYSGLCARLP